MGVFLKKKYISAARANTLPQKYRAAMAKYPFLFFGLPFMVLIVGGSFALTPVTAIRYEKFDRKMRQTTQQEELHIQEDKRNLDIREEYFRLMSKRDLDDWEPKRVERLPGESNGRM